MKDTNQQFQHVITLCRELFAKKLHDYGAAWRIMRPMSVTDQIFIKANRIRSIETKGISLIDEGVRSEFIGIINYSIIALIQLELGYAANVDLDNDEALALYDKYAAEALELMKAKNHDYDEAWRGTHESKKNSLRGNNSTLFNLIKRMSSPRIFRSSLFVKFATTLSAFPAPFST